ncbi:MAG: hypothetical protein PHQ27_08460, partial [Victivallales bacterium]|nr:hypothetical protein [Victivallales bacterium]
DLTIYATVDGATVTQLRQLPSGLAAVLPRVGRDFLADNGFAAAWARIAVNTPATEKHLRQAFHVWFDAFRTLKFVHYCEDNFPAEFPRADVGGDNRD